MSNVTISVWMITYNHQDYIAQAIDSILNQRTTFEIEIVIGDDASTDNTQEIIKQYVSKYPEIIKPIYNQQNIGIQRNFAATMDKCKGKYIALCEGDDYWTDSLKLQKQVDFLEKNVEFSMACNASSEVRRDGTEFKIATREEQVVDLALILREGWFIRTASIVFRRSAIKGGFPDFFYRAYSTDYILQVMILIHGKCKYFPNVMSAYRWHEEGFSQASKQLQLSRWLTKIELLDILNIFTEKEYELEIKEHQIRIKQIISFYLYRYPNLFKSMGANFYLEHANPYLFLKYMLKSKFG